MKKLVSNEILHWIFYNLNYEDLTNVMLVSKLFFEVASKIRPKYLHYKLDYHSIYSRKFLNVAEKEIVVLDFQKNHENGKRMMVYKHKHLGKETTFARGVTLNGGDFTIIPGTVFYAKLSSAEFFVFARHRKGKAEKGLYIYDIKNRRRVGEFVYPSTNKRLGIVGVDRRGERLCFFYGTGIAVFKFKNENGVSIRNYNLPRSVEINASVLSMQDNKVFLASGYGDMWLCSLKANDLVLDASDYLSPLYGAISSALMVNDRLIVGTNLGFLLSRKLDGERYLSGFVSNLFSYGDRRIKRIQYFSRDRIIVSTSHKCFLVSAINGKPILRLHNARNSSGFIHDVVLDGDKLCLLYQRGSRLLTKISPIISQYLPKNFFNSSQTIDHTIFHCIEDYRNNYYEYCCLGRMSYRGDEDSEFRLLVRKFKKFLLSDPDAVNIKNARNRTLLGVAIENRSHPLVYILGECLNAKLLKDFLKELATEDTLVRIEKPLFEVADKLIRSYSKISPKIQYLVFAIKACYYLRSDKLFYAKNYSKKLVKQESSFESGSLKEFTKLFSTLLEKQQEKRLLYARSFLMKSLQTSGVVINARLSGEKDNDSEEDSLPTIM